MVDPDLRLKTAWSAYDLIASVKAAQLTPADDQHLCQLAVPSTMAASVAVYLAHYARPVGTLRPCS